MQEVSSPVRGEFLLKRRSAPGKGLGNAAAIDQAWHSQAGSRQIVPPGTPAERSMKPL
jgi:hypothetical protein